MGSSITSFRQVLRQAWSRRVFLIVTTATPPLPLNRLTVDYITNLRDPEWEEQERSYHETALSEVNSLVRKHNAMAPYIARRALYTRRAELDRMYNESAKEVHEELLAKLRSGKGDEPTFGSARNNDDGSVVARGSSLPSLSVWKMFKELFTWVRHIHLAFCGDLLRRLTAASGSNLAFATALMAGCVIVMAVLIVIGGGKSELQAREEPGSSGTDVPGKQRCVRAWVKFLVFG